MSDDMMSLMKMDSMSMSGVDHEFADMMIKHHKDGIMMAKNILRYYKTLKLRSLAQKIIAEQTKDIHDLQTWMNNHKG